MIEEVVEEEVEAVAGWGMGSHLPIHVVEPRKLWGLSPAEMSVCWSEGIVGMEGIGGGHRCASQDRSVWHDLCPRSGQRMIIAWRPEARGMEAE
jgi:hypothetical protein